MMSSSSNNNDADTENELTTTTTTTTGLRQRKGGSYTATATANGNTLRNGAHNIYDNNNTSNDNNNSDNYNVGPRKAMSDIEVKKDEKRLQKILIRAISGLTLIIFFMICVYLGHLYVCGLVALSEFLLFRELVKVRYNTFYKSRIQNTIPLFRTTQWLWFNVAIFYTYSDFISGRVIENNMHLHYLLKYTNPYFNIVLPFLLYSITFVITITTFKQGHIKFQLNQLCWTIVVLCLTVGQMKYIMHNIFNGLFWFTFPFLLVVCNDVMAYFVGISIGRKFIKRSFMVVSPNKTWEGFIGTYIYVCVWISNEYDLSIYFFSHFIFLRFVLFLHSVSVSVYKIIL
jgi:CDP-diglyceride synthetase